MLPVGQVKLSGKSNKPDMPFTLHFIYLASSVPPTVDALRVLIRYSHSPPLPPVRVRQVVVGVMPLDVQYATPQSDFKASVVEEL